MAPVVGEEPLGPRDLPPELLRLHDEAVRAGDPTYVDPATGYLVMTAASLRDRRACCGSGCRHCPYS